jgi:hypothetical protein
MIEATNTNCIVFGLTPPGLEPTILRHRWDSVVGFSEQENKAMNKLMRFLFNRLMFRIFSNVQNLFRIFINVQNFQNLFRIFSNVQNLFRIFSNVQNLFRIFNNEILNEPVFVLDILKRVWKFCKLLKILNRFWTDSENCWKNVSKHYSFFNNKNNFYLQK